MKLYECIKHAQQENKRDTKSIDQGFKDKEEKNCITVRLEVSPQAQDHSNKVVAKQSNT